MTREELTAMFSEYNGEETTPERRTEILGAIMDENDRLYRDIDDARNAQTQAVNDYNALKTQYVNRFLSGGPANPGGTETTETDDGGKPRKFSDLFKKGE